MIAMKPTMTKASLPSPGAVAGDQQVDAGEQQDDHPRVDQVAVDLLDPGQDRRRRPRILRRDREEERVAEGRAEGQHDREDVQEQRDLVVRARRSRRRASAETLSLSRDGAAGPPSRRPGGGRPRPGRHAAKAAATSSSSVGSRPEQTSVGGEGGPSVAAGRPPGLPRPGSVGDRVEDRRGHVGDDGRGELGEPFAQVDSARESSSTPLAAAFAAAASSAGGSWS